MGYGWTIVLASAVVVAGQNLPSQESAKEVTEICGVVSAIQMGPERCDALLQVDTASGKATVLVPASVRRVPSGEVRPLQGGEVCFKGTPEKPPASVNLRVTNASAIRIVKPASERSDTFGEGAADMCESEVSAPRMLANVAPRYSEQAMRARIEGVVQLEAIVLPTGEVGMVRVIKSLEPSLDVQAVTAFKGWKFAPGMRQGKPVPVLVSVEMKFALRKR